MTGQDNADDAEGRRRWRNRTLFALLAAFVALVYAITLVKIGQGGGG